jgi:methionyl aminopeptidase
MAIIIKTPEQIDILREAGKIHAKVLNHLEKFIKIGMKATELDAEAARYVRELGGEPAFLNYRPDPSYPKYPASLCVSINETIVHGIPTDDMVFKDGDLVSIDFGVEYKGLFTDSARTIMLGNVSKEKKQLVYDIREALARGIEAAVVGNTIGDIGYAIESFNNKKYGNVKELSGHGVGVKIHEDPYIPNYGKPGQGAKLKEGMVIAIEPMFNLGTSDVIFWDDMYTVVTADGMASAHVEHTIAITKDGPEILTKI